MDRTYEDDAGGATYRSKDPIKNLKLRINLKRVSPAILEVLRSRVAEEGAGESRTTVSASATTVDEFGQTVLEEESITCQWQEKFFSAREFELYGVNPVQGTVEEYKYHNDVQRMKKEGGRKNVRIFTHIETDYLPEDGQVLLMTTSPDETQTDLSRNMMELRRRKPVQGGGKNLSAKLRRGFSARGLKIVVKDPSDEFKKNNHVLNTPVHRMLIMADLSPEGQLGSQAYEKRLCEIEYDENGVLRITPDFTRNKLPYKVESGLSRDNWMYTINTASATMTRLEMQKQARLMKQLYTKHQKYLTDLVGTAFEEVPSGVLRLVTNGEIVSARSFEYDDLHIEYFVDLPRDWSLQAGQMLSGCTHTCRTTLQDNIEVAYYSHPFSYDMYLAFNKDDLAESSPEWPKLYLQVVSSDTWGRRRTEGYGFAPLPSSPGSHTIKVDCWRPIGNAGTEAVVHEMRRFFIGSSPELEDPTYVGVPSTFEGSVLCKYGVRTESTGSVTVRANCIIQQEQVAEKVDAIAANVRRKKQQTALQLAKGKAASEAIHGVMDAFLRARKRMQAAREAVPEHIRTAAEERTQGTRGDGDRSEHLDRVLAGETTWRPEEESDHEKTA